MTREILLIDDDEDEIDLFSEALHAFDKSIQCSQVKDLDGALEFLKSSSPAYIFIDFNMPKLNGFDCLAELKKIDKLDQARIILYSNHINDEMIERANALGAYRCVKKPHMLDLLSRRLKEILNSGPDQL